MQVNLSVCICHVLTAGGHLLLSIPCDAETQPLITLYQQCYYWGVSATLNKTGDIRPDLLQLPIRDVHVFAFLIAPGYEVVLFRQSGTTWDHVTLLSGYEPCMMRQAFDMVNDWSTFFWIRKIPSTSTSRKQLYKVPVAYIVLSWIGLGQRPPHVHFIQTT
jgi:hypothetical protein